MKPDTHKILSSYGLKYHPFDTDRPVSSIYAHPWMERETWNIENLVMDGGICCLIGTPGSGKSAFLRYLNHRLTDIPDAQIVHLNRPQSSLGDFYKELGLAFGMNLGVSRRYGSFNTLREKWSIHISSTHLRPVLIVDEAQLMLAQTLTELRILSSENFDSRKLLTIILAGDERLWDKLESPDLLPLKSRINPCINLEPMTGAAMEAMLRHILLDAGNPSLMSDKLILLLSEQCSGDPRTLMKTGRNLLLAAYRQDKDLLDESLYYDVIQNRLNKPRKPKTRRQSNERA